MATEAEVRSALAQVQDPELGPSKPESMASQLEMPFLGCLPIDPNIAALCDRGEIESYPGDLFGPIAKKISELTPVAVSPKTKRHEAHGA